MASSSQKLLAKQNSLHYRGWLIHTATINGRLWVRWQHPQDNFPRYNCAVGEQGLAETIDFVKSYIDLAIELEEEHNSQELSN